MTGINHGAWARRRWCGAKRCSRSVGEAADRDEWIGGAQAAADDFRPAAANQIGRVTRETLNAVAFPTFVADLIHSTFNAITQSSVQQIEAYVRLLDNVSKTVDQFMNNSVSDPQAHTWLAEMYPNHIRLEGGQAVHNRTRTSAHCRTSRKT